MIEENHLDVTIKSSGQDETWSMGLMRLSTISYNLMWQQYQQSMTKFFLICLAHDCKLLQLNDVFIFALFKCLTLRHRSWFFYSINTRLANSSELLLCKIICFLSFYKPAKVTAQISKERRPSSILYFLFN